MSEHKILKTIHVCPKCGNEEGLIVIPGSGMKFYYCPACPKQKAPVADQKDNENN
jgi:ssDNA-binding Zn-finger/Zn-ribbon topoisomerase 1